MVESRAVDRYMRWVLIVGVEVSIAFCARELAGLVFCLRLDKRCFASSRINSFLKRNCPPPMDDASQS